MAGRLLFIAVWGLPSGWSETRYYPLVPPKKLKEWVKIGEWKASEHYVLSNSTAIAEIRLLIEHEWSVKLLVFGLDTIATPGGREKTGCQEAASVFKETISEAGQNPPSDYAGLSMRARRLLETYLRCFIGRTLSGSLDYEIVVLPGVGHFAAKGTKYWYRASPLTARTALEYKLYKTLRGFKPDAVILDLSHGVNYLPAIAFQALRRSLNAYAAIEGERPAYAVMNSDPVMDSGQESYIHLIEAGVAGRGLLELVSELASSPVFQASGATGRAYRMMKPIEPPKPLAELNKAHDSLTKRVSGLIKALARASSYGFALYIASRLEKLATASYREDQARLEALFETVSGLNPGETPVRIDHSSGVVQVVWKYQLQPHILDALYAAEALEKLLGIYKEELGHSSLTVEGKGIRMYDLDGLRSFMEAIGPSSIGLTLFKNEYHDIKERVENYVKNRGPGSLEIPTPYAVVYETSGQEHHEGRGERGSKCEIDKRNFYAHAGMERNSILVMAIDKKIYVGYRHECLSRIERIVTND